MESTKQGVTRRCPLFRGFLVLTMVAVAVLALGAEARAIVVHFDTLTSGPTDVLQTSGVTVTGSNRQGASAPVASLQGAGLGVAGIAPSYSVDTQVTFLVSSSASPYWGGWTFMGDYQTERITLRADGPITSVTLQPYFTVLGGPGPSFQNSFELTYYYGPNAPGGKNYMRFDDPSSPKTFVPSNFGPDHPTTMIELAMADLSWGAYGDFSRIMSYLDQSGYPHQPVTVQYGYTVVSLDYTPVPEPSTLLLLASGLAGLGGIAWRRHRTSRDRQDGR